MTALVLSCWLLTATLAVCAALIARSAVRLQPGEHRHRLALVTLFLVSACAVSGLVALGFTAAALAAEHAPRQGCPRAGDIAGPITLPQHHTEC